MPDLTSTSHLKNLIVADSHTLLKLLPAASNFIDLHPKTWSQNADFVAVKAMIENLPALNDAAERALAFVTNIHFSHAAPKLYRTKKDRTTVRHSCRQKLKKHVQQQQHELEQRFNSRHEQILKSFDPWEENRYIIWYNRLQSDKISQNELFNLQKKKTKKPIYSAFCTIVEKNYM